MNNPTCIIVILTVIKYIKKTFPCKSKPDPQNKPSILMHLHGPIYQTALLTMSTFQEVRGHMVTSTSQEIMPSSKRCKVQLSSSAQYAQITERHELNNISATLSKCQKHKPSDGRSMSRWEGRLRRGKRKREGDGALRNWAGSETGPNKNCWH